MDFESQIHLRAICQLNLRNREVGAYLLENGNQYRLCFGFSLPGVHPYIGKSKIEATLKAWSEGIRGFPSHEPIAIHSSSSPQWYAREQELEERAQKSDLPSLSFLNYVGQRHARELSEGGHRCSYQTNIFTTYSYEPGTSFEQDLLEKAFVKVFTPVKNAYLTFKGTKTQERKAFLSDLFAKAFDESFLRWEQQLNSRMGLHTTPLQGSHLWDYAWEQFNLTPSSDIPHLITATEVDGRIVIDEPPPYRLAPASVLVLGEKGKPSVPEEDYRWIKVKGQYVAAMVLEQRLEGYGGIEHQFKFFWQPFLEIPGLKVVWECQSSNSTLDQIDLQRTLRFQKGMAKWTEGKGGHSVVADLEIQDSLDAQKKMLQGGRSVSISVAYFITRNTIRELDVACQQLATIFPEGKLIRETDIVPELWRNQQPFTWPRLVGSMRRETYMNDEISLPVICTKSFDRRGMEFITFEGGKPIYIDPTIHHNQLTIARTRKGKSTKTADEIFTDLSYRVPVLVLDYGMVEGRTTYSDLVDFVGEGGANVEVASTEYNFLETPNLLHLKPQTRKKQETTFQSFILSSLETLILGDERGTRFAKRVRAFLDYLTSLFFDDPIVRARYDAAHHKGIGSAAWNQMPVLPDLRELAARIDLDDLGGREIASESRDEVVMMLSTFLRSPLGRSLSRPSKVKLSAPFLNFSLRGARNDDEATVIGTVAQAIATTRALEHPRSRIYVDEGSVLFEKPGLVYNTAEMVVNGGKSGIGVSILSQDLPTIATCAAGPKFLTNTDIKTVGSIDESDIGDLSHYLKKPPEVFARNAQEDFSPDPIRLCSHWLLLAEGTTTYISHYPSPELMALVASNSDERRARDRYFEAYGDPIEAIAVFSRDYTKARKSGLPMEELVPPHERERSDPIVFAA
jgi:hypothetical protein